MPGTSIGGRPPCPRLNSHANSGAAFSSRITTGEPGATGDSPNGGVGWSGGVGCISSPLIPDSRPFRQITFQHDGINRQYRIHVPDGLSESPPVVFALHGYGGGNNDMMSNYGWREVADEEKFIVVCPNGTRDNSNRRFWDVDYDFHPQFDIDDDGFLSSLAIHIQDTLGADPERTFVTGFSNGAEMVLQLACRESETFTGFGSVIGMMLEPLFNDCNPTVKRPILAMNGTAGGITIYGGDLGNSGGWSPYGSSPNLISFWGDTVETPILDRSFLENRNPNDGSSVRLDRDTAKKHAREVRFYSINGWWIRLVGTIGQHGHRRHPRGLGLLRLDRTRNSVRSRRSESRRPGQLGGPWNHALPVGAGTLRR